MISVIIPTYNEAAHIQSTIKILRQHDIGNHIKEIIVADGGSTDDTTSLVQQELAKVVVSPKKGRAVQMNYGASYATQKLLYFLHADTIPPIGFSNDIVDAVAKGYKAGCFMLSFDYNHWFLKANCWFTRFDVNAFRYGDQSLFVEQTTFEDVYGFCEKHIVFEDYAIIKQLRKNSRFGIIRKPVITSARKYLDNGIFKMQGIFYLMYFLYCFGASQKSLVATYKRLIKQDKL